MTATNFEIPRYFTTHDLGMIDPTCLVYSPDWADDIRQRYTNAGVNLRSRPYVATAQTGELTYPNGESIVRDVARERHEIETYLASQDPQYLEAVSSLTEDWPAMSDDCRIAVTIVVPKHNEYVYNTLNQWAISTDLHGEPLDDSKYEINVIARWAEGYKDSYAAGHIRRFQASHPQTRVNYLDMTFTNEAEEASIGRGQSGMANKIISDAILLRSLARINQRNPLYLEISESNAQAIDPMTLARSIRDMDNKPFLDALVGMVDLSPHDLLQDDLKLFVTRMGQIATRLIEAKRLRPLLSSRDAFMNVLPGLDINSALSAEALALVGGYVPIGTLEHKTVSDRIRLMRGSHRDGTLTPLTSTIASSSTRLLQADNAEPLPTVWLPDAKLNKKNIGHFERLLGRMFVQQETFITDRAELGKQQRLLTTFLGLEPGDYSVEDDGSVSISNIANLQRAFQRYHSRHAPPDVRSMYGPAEAAAFADFSRNSLTWRFVEKPAYKQYLEHYPPESRAGIDVLDAGCGSGRIAELLATEEGFDSGRIIGLDLSEDNIREARRLASGPNFVVGDVRKLELADESVDLVIAHMLFEFLDPEGVTQALNEFYRVLRKGGMLLYITTNPQAMSLDLGIDLPGWYSRRSPWHKRITNYLRTENDYIGTTWEAGFRQGIADRPKLSSEAEAEDPEAYKRYQASRLLIQGIK